MATKMQVRTITVIMGMAMVQVVNRTELGEIIVVGNSIEQANVTNPIVNLTTGAPTVGHGGVMDPICVKRN